MKKFRLLLLFSGSILWAHAEGFFKRQPWNQEEAVAKVEGIIEVEKKGEPWNEIAWEIDPARAAAKAQRLNKPVFVYFYLRKPVGPAGDPG